LEDGVGSFEIYAENNGKYVDDYWKQSRDYSARRSSEQMLSYLEDEKYVLSIDSDVMFQEAV
jgi:hypothetical protein